MYFYAISGNNFYIYFSVQWKKYSKFISSKLSLRISCIFHCKILLSKRDFIHKEEIWYIIKVKTQKNLDTAIYGNYKQEILLLLKIFCKIVLDLSFLCKSARFPVLISKRAANNEKWSTKFNIKHKWDREFFDRELPLSWCAHCLL